jgi:16S rRNA G1207 methylase RsmC
VKTDFGSYSLERLPKTTKGDLRAWDAADELLLSHLFENHLKDNDQPILIINDNFGALAVALHDYPRHSWTDSTLAHLATLKNLKHNDLGNVNYQAIPSTTDLEQSYQLVIIKIPKTLDLLEDQLSRLKPHINADTIIIGSAMSKHIHTSTLKVFEKLIGTTTTSRATKKARLIFATNDNEISHSSPFPKTIKDDELNLTLINHANVFSKDRLDMGSRLLIEQIKRCPSSKHIVDLGCGNGALGIMANRLQPEAHISFIDESYAAVKSAEESYHLDHKDKEPNASFYNSDCFSQFDGRGVDLILCNPPFHQNHSIGDHLAWEMFKQSHEQLEDGGEIWVIGNRHLAYHVKLKTLFGNCKTVASNKKFVVLVAKKT